MDTHTTILLASLCILMLTAPRSFFLFPFVMAVCFIPMNQRLFIVGLDFTVLRVLVLFGLIRLLFKNEMRDVRWNYFDKLIFSWVLVETLVYTLQWQTFSAFINRLGVAFDCIGMYWLFRHIIRNWEDVAQIIKFFGFFAIITAPMVALEKFHQPSFFSFFGPVEAVFDRGRFRCAGPFPHAIMMGTFWASLLPLFYARIKNNSDKLFFWLSIFAALSNVYFSASSTPIMTVVAVIVFWKLYNIRSHGKELLYAFCFCLLILHLVMNKPVWHLMARADIFGGSTGWHRYHLFNEFVHNMPEWFLLGTKNTGHWGYGLQDVTNQFVLEAVRGGFVTLLIFCKIVYNAIKLPCKFSLIERNQEIVWLTWGICVAMFGHFITFWGVSYFGQINMLLYLTFAFSGFSLECIQKSERRDQSSLVIFS